MKFIVLIITIIILSLCSCRRNYEPPVDFYYWKTNVDINDTEKDYFSKLESKKLYIRFFDIDKENDEIKPKAIIKNFGKELSEAEYIPVVFITNRTLEGIDENGIRLLAENSFELIRNIENSAMITPSSEIQIDCDWTLNTKDTYFRFLNELRNISQCKISCTLRLHQVKYKEKTGIPPVGKVYLMCYATTDPKDNSSNNSILDIELLKDYLKDLQDYPLTMDFALPLFSWGVVTNHLGNIKLINGLTLSDVDNKDFRLVKDNTYITLTDVFLKGIYISKGFSVRIESITSELLNEAKRFISKKSKNNYSILYYHLDSQFLKQFKPLDLK